MKEISNIIKFVNNNNDYEKWNLYDASSLKRLNNIHYNIDPFSNKLFNQDIIKVNNKGEFIKIIHSSNREMYGLPGILNLSNNFNQLHNTYIVTPDDKRLPNFKIKISKRIINKYRKYKQIYVIIRYNNWKEEIPDAEMVSIIGNVKKLSNYYEYQLYCKSLYASIQNFTKKTMLKIKNKCDIEIVNNIMNNPNYNIEDRTNQQEWNIITIDAKETKDFDDAFGIKYEKNEDITILSIYISNVTVWLNYLDLWDSFTSRVTNIYLPDRKRPMLPTVLSETLCSLKEGENRITFVIDIFIKNNQIINTEFKNACINVTKNYIYNEQSLLNNTTYLLTYDTINKLQFKYFNKMIGNIIDSHDLITFIMVLMNYLCGKELYNEHNGIFRMIKYDNDENIPESLPKDIRSFLHNWYNSGSQYVEIKDIQSHKILKLESYVHITSPIRRLIDILNISIIQIHKNIININENGTAFIKYWTNEKQLHYINSSMKAIRKLQNNCNLIYQVHKNPMILERKYEGYIIEKVQRNDGLYQYVAFIPELHFMNKYTCRNEYQRFTKMEYTLHMFEDENTFQKKIMFGFE